MGGCDFPSSFMSQSIKQLLDATIPNRLRNVKPNMLKQLFDYTNEKVTEASGTHSTSYKTTLEVSKMTFFDIEKKHNTLKAFLI